MKRCLLFLILVFASTACDSKKGAAEKAPDKEEDYVAEYAANRPQWLPADSRIVFSFTFRDGWTDDLGMLMIKATMSKGQFEALGVHKFLVTKDGTFDEVDFNQSDYESSRSLLLFAMICGLSEELIEIDFKTREQVIEAEKKRKQKKHEGGEKQEGK